jgi:tetratricopeptide (TPR) repeat protein
MLARQGRDQDALAQYEESLRLRPDHYEAHMNIGALLSRLGRPDAIQHFQKAAEIRPTSPEPRIYLALAYANANDPGRAVVEVEAAAGINQVEANRFFSTAVRIPFKDTNLADFRAALMAQAGKK